MRSTIFATLTAICLGGLLLAGCNRQQTSNGQPQSSPAAPAAPSAPGQPGPAQAADLSPDANQKFLADNAKKPGVMVLPSGLQYRVVKAGSGKSPTAPSDNVTVTYKGWLIDGKVFDQTQPGQTATFPAGQLIPGWVEALRMMKEGDEWELVIPSNLAYGESGAPGAIPPNQTLVFDMTLLKVEPAGAPSP